MVFRGSWWAARRPGNLGAVRCGAVRCGAVRCGPLLAGAGGVVRARTRGRGRPGGRADFAGQSTLGEPHPRAGMSRDVRPDRGPGMAC
jgi:hypothetical protein